MTSKQYISNAGNVLRLDDVENRLQFCQVSETNRLKDACLLATCNFTKVLKVMDGTNKLPPEVPRHLVTLVDAPCSIVQDSYLNVQSIDDSMLFYVKKLGGGYTFESKKYASVLDVYHERENYPIHCHYLKSAAENRLNQVFTCEHPPKAVAAEL